MLLFHCHIRQLADISETSPALGIGDRAVAAAFSFLGSDLFQDKRAAMLQNILADIFCGVVEAIADQGVGGHGFVNYKFRLVSFIMAAYVNQGDGFFADDELNSDSVADIDRDAVQSFEFAFEGMQAQGRMKRVVFQQEQGFFVLFEQVGMFFDKRFGPFDVALRKDQFISHR